MGTDACGLAEDQLAVGIEAFADADAAPVGSVAVELADTLTENELDAHTVWLAVEECVLVEHKEEDTVTDTERDEVTEELRVDVPLLEADIALVKKRLRELLRTLRRL